MQGAINIVTARLRVDVHRPEAPTPAEIGEWAEAAHAVGYRMARLARQVGWSERRLRRYFLHRFGRCPKDLIDEARVAGAARALQQGRTVKVVAADFFYQDGSHLYHAVRRYLGTTPSQILKTAPDSMTDRGCLLQMKGTFLQTDCLVQGTSRVHFSTSGPEPGQ